MDAFSPIKSPPVEYIYSGTRLEQLGGRDQEVQTGGRRDESEKEYHINAFEILFKVLLQYENRFVCYVNTTAVACINEKGGIISKAFNNLAKVFHFNKSFNYNIYISFNSFYT